MIQCSNSKVWCKRPDLVNNWPLTPFSILRLWQQITSHRVYNSTRGEPILYLFYFAVNLFIFTIDQFFLLIMCKFLLQYLKISSMCDYSIRIDHGECSIRISRSLAGHIYIYKAKKPSVRLSHR